MQVTNLPDAIAASIRRHLGEIHTCLPARVESYDHKKQRASVQPQIKKKYRDGLVDDMPVIVDVPVIWPRSSNASLTFPVNKGDYVMLVFAERAIENFLTLGGLQEPGDRRKFDLTDAIAVPGLYPFNVPSRSTNNEDVLLIYNNTSIRIKKDGDLEIVGSKNMKATIKGNIEVTCEGNLTANVGGNATIDIGGTTDLTSGGDVNITAPNVNITGNLTVSGQTDLAGGGPGIARQGDSVEVQVTGGSSAGTYSGTITGSSGNSRSG